MEAKWTVWYASDQVVTGDITAYKVMCFQHHIISGDIIQQQFLLGSAEQMVGQLLLSTIINMEKNNRVMLGHALWFDTQNDND